MHRPGRSSAPPIERASADDLMQLAADVGPVREQVGAVLVLEAGGGFDAAAAARTVARRLGVVPRFGQLLVRTPPGCGRPVWLDDPGFDSRLHVGLTTCPPPGDETALLAEAVRLVTEPLPEGKPPWRAAVVTGLADGRAALVVVFHHVLTDGIGGLAVLEELVDGPAEEAADPAAEPESASIRRPTGSPRAMPTPWQLAEDAWSARLRALARAPTATRRLVADVGAMRRTGMPRAGASSLNQPTGPHRRAVVVRTELDLVRAAAHAQGATVNDVVLTAVAGALRNLLLQRGEDVPTIVASVPVSRRTATTTEDLGNRLGGMVVPLSVATDRAERLRAIAAETRTRKSTPGELLMGPVFRLVGALGLTKRFVYHQHMISTFVTDLRGPPRPLTVLGCPVLEILPVSHLTGNVTTTFAALSYASGLVVTITADPQACPDLDALAGLLQAELDALAGTGSTGLAGDSRIPFEWS